MKKSACPLILLLLLFAVTATAAEPVNNHQLQKKESPKQTQPAVKMEDEKTTAKPQKKPPDIRVKSFTPSEKIDADAVIAFPVDI
ncbi:MAG: hypothetical protein U9P37_06485 [Pseudomonadota bacterium]|nr:hypothetical protein [Pseudomonadota bacterium]